MKRTGTFEWMPEANAAFEELKRYLATPPIMVAPWTHEPLLLYLAATPHAASAVLVAEQEEPVPAIKIPSMSQEPEPPDASPSGLARGLPAQDPSPAESQEEGPAASPEKPPLRRDLATSPTATSVGL